MLPPGLKGSIGRPFFTHYMSDLSIYRAWPSSLLFQKTPNIPWWWCTRMHHRAKIDPGPSENVSVYTRQRHETTEVESYLQGLKINTVTYQMHMCTQATFKQSHLCLIISLSLTKHTLNKSNQQQVWSNRWVFFFCSELPLCFCIVKNKVLWSWILVLCSVTESQMGIRSFSLQWASNSRPHKKAT